MQQQDWAPLWLSYFEAEGRIGWLEGMKRDQAREFLKGQVGVLDKAIPIEVRSPS